MGAGPRSAMRSATALTGAVHGVAGALPGAAVCADARAGAGRGH